MGDPATVILDEPTVGLDPLQVTEMRTLIRELAQSHTVVFSSHILSEIESIADTVGIIHHGRMRKEISMRDIEESNLNYIEVTVSDEKRAVYILSEKLGLSNFKLVEGGTIRIYEPEASTSQLSKAMSLNDVEVLSIGRNTETLEDYFLKLTGEVDRSC